MNIESDLSKYAYIWSHDRRLADLTEIFAYREIPSREAGEEISMNNRGSGKVSEQTGNTRSIETVRKCAVTGTSEAPTKLQPLRTNGWTWQARRGCEPSTGAAVLKPSQWTDRRPLSKLLLWNSAPMTGDSSSSKTAQVGVRGTDRG